MYFKFKSNTLKVIVGAIMAIAAVIVIFQVPIVFAQIGGNINLNNTSNSNNTLPGGVGGTVNIVPPPATDTTTNGDAGGFVICGNTADNPCQIGHLFAAFVVIINYLIAMAAFVAVLAIVYAGFMMIYSQGQEKLKEAKGRFAGAVIGMVLVAAAFVLINALFSGNLSIGVKDGANILANPLEYINKDVDNIN